MNPKFSVITVCYNSKSKLENTVNSVRMQKFHDYEYIIVDGKSNDGTDAFISQIESKLKIKYICEPDDGLYDAMNKAIKNSKGEFLYFLNAGDTFVNELVLDKLSGVCSTPNTVYFGTSKAVYVGGVVRSNRIYTSNCKKIKYEVLNGRMPNHQAIIAHKNCFKYNIFDITYELGADFKWFATCVKRKMNIEKIDICIANFEIGGKSTRPLGRRKMLEEYDEILKNTFPLQYRIFELRSIQRIRKEKSKYISLFNILEQWMAGKQNGKRIDLYLENKGYRIISIYGMGVLGNLLYNELKNSSVKVKCAIDRTAHDMTFDLPVFDVEEFKEKEMDNVNLVIITAILSKQQFKEIEREIACNVIALEDIVYDMFG